MEDSPNEAERRQGHQRPGICSAADLHAGQEGVGVAGDFGDACTAGVLQFHLVDLRAAQTHQREFGAGEYRSEQQEDEDQQDVQTK